MSYAVYNMAVALDQQVDIDFDIAGYNVSANTAQMIIQKEGTTTLFTKDLTITGTDQISGTIALTEATDSGGTIAYNTLGAGSHAYAIKVVASLGRVMWKIQGQFVIASAYGADAAASALITAVTITLDGTLVASVTIGSTPITSGIPAGDDGEIQYNDSSLFASSASYVVAPASGLVALSSNKTDTTAKTATYVSNHYTNAEQPLAMVTATAGSTTNLVSIGGGLSSTNAATLVGVYTAANSTTVTGTLALSVDAAQNVRIGTGAAEARLDVAGAIAITDGMTAPTAVSGKALLYVDTADGDLKVRFADGHTATIAADS